VACAAVSVHGLRKVYAGHEVVRGIDFEVAAGEVFGFLGPNGAGKTTTIEILEGYRERTDGEVSVLGADPARPTRPWRERVGLVLQECELDPLLTVTETLKLFSAFYSSPRPVSETVGLVGLEEKRDARAGTLSGGQRRRLDVAVALVGRPELVFLDEPTTGFDPSARREAWTMIEGLKAEGTTVFLTTHYFTAGMIAYAIALQGFTQLAISVTTLRETGQLKRLRGTPMPTWTFMVAQVLRVLAFTVFMVVLLLAIGVIAFGVKIPAEGVLPLVVYVALGTAAMVTLGLAATVIFNSADAASSAAPFIAVMLSFVSGVFLSVTLLPNWLESVGRVFPLYHLAEGLQRSLVPGGGSGLNGTNVAVLAAWGLGGLVFAARRFRWESQGDRG
jgi:ABC-type Mn2+/Zn2+ transport system ATPase subunit